MGTTNSTRKELNKGRLDGSGYTDYADHIFVNTGNQKDTEGKVKNGKYVNGQVKNMTYTLPNKKNDEGIFEETVSTVNYYDSMNFEDTGYHVFGHPDKWVYDSHQKYNNCGVVSALNVLSMAGKLSVTAPTQEEIDAFKAKTKTKTTSVLNPDTMETETKTITTYPYKNADYTSSEELLTLYAMQKHYCFGSYDSSKYKSIDNLNKEDGGSFFNEVNQENRLYHDSMNDINAILADYGVKSSTKLLSMFVQCGSSDVDGIKELNDNPTEETTESSNSGTNSTTTSEEKATNDIWTIHKDYSIYDGRMNLAIDSTDGADTINFADLSMADIQKEYFTFVRSGTSLVINYNETNYVEIKNVYNEDTKDRTCISKITFGVEGTDSYDEYTLASIAEGRYGIIYDEEALATPTRQYGYFVRELAELVKEGKGIILQGYATSGFSKNDTVERPNHAITLTGVAYKYYDTDKAEASKNIFDIAGFYVVDSGYWLDSNPTGAQFITCEQLYNFMACSEYFEKNDTKFAPAGERRHKEVFYISTDECIKDWADDLNLIGNDRRNTLFGNDGNNILKGGGSTDNLYGKKGNDTLYGGTGNDWLYGGEGNNTLYGQSGNDTYVLNSIARDYIFEKDINGDYILDENYSPQLILGPDNKPCYEEQENHDLIIPGSGKDYLRFERVYYTNVNKEKIPISDPISAKDLEYYNDHGNLVIRYDFYNKLNDEGEIVKGYSSVTVKDYFKKGLYSNIAWLDDDSTIAQRKKDNKNHAYKFLSEISKTDILYDIDKDVKNNILGSKFNDTIETGNQDDTIVAGAGSDIITPGAGDNTIKLGAGNDELNLGYGNNKVYLEAGRNTIIYNEDTSGYDTIYSGKGNDTIELKSKTVSDLEYARKGNNLIIYYDHKGANPTGSSITIMNYFKNPAKCSIRELILKDNVSIALRNGLSGIDSIDCLDKTSGTTSGLGNDTLFGGNGNNTYTFNTKYDGIDTIKKQKSGSITLDLTDTGVTRNEDIGFVNGFNRYKFGEKNYAYTKSGNNLIIKYGTGIENESMSRIILQNYFKSKLSYTLKIGGDDWDLRNALVYFEGLQDSKNKITGSNQNDLIYGGKLADTIKAGAGNDIIYSGKGNDAITGGSGKNEIHYTYGDGNNTITLSKNESLSLVLHNSKEGTFAPEEVMFSFDKKGNLLIEYEDKTILTIKNFKKKDTTGTNGAIQLFVEDALILNLKDDIFIGYYDSFSKKKHSYTGKYYSEFIDASRLDGAINKKNKGVTVKAGGGDDIVLGSDYNDTIKGGTGNDLIIAGNGKNSVDGGAGDDRYYLFYDGALSDGNGMKESDSTHDYRTYEEITTIKDTGSAAENDTAFIYETNDNLNLWFNINANGRILNDTNKKGKDLGTLTFHIATTDDRNSATLTGVEHFVDKNGAVYEKDDIANEVATWLQNHHYQTVAQAVADSGRGIEDLYAIFRNGWSADNTYKNFEYSDFTKDNFVYSGKWYSETIDASGLTEAVDGEKKGASINAGGGDDTIIGSKYNDSLAGGAGSDTFLFKDIENGNGNDLIVDGENSDILKFEAGENSYANEDGKLVITNTIGTTESKVTINNFDFTATEQIKNLIGEITAITTSNIDKVIIGDIQQSILNDAEIIVKLKNGKNFTGTDYTEIITGIGSVSNLSSGLNTDKIKMDNINNLVFSRKNHGGLVITDKEGEDDTNYNRITVTDFNFASKDEENAVSITNGTGEIKTSDENLILNVSLDDGFSYNSTPWKEVITLNGSATFTNVAANLDNNDVIKINGDVTPEFLRTNSDLKIRYGFETVTLRNFNFYNDPNSNFNTIETSNSTFLVKDQELEYTITGDTYDSKEYDKNGTETGNVNQYKEIFNGYGILKNFDRTNDKIRLDYPTIFSRTNTSDDLVATYTSESQDKYSITVTDFFKNTTQDINFVGDITSTGIDSTEDMELNVTLVAAEGEEQENKVYTATKYKEIITGTGVVKGLAKIGDDKADSIEISLQEGEEVKYTKKCIKNNQGTGLIVSSDANSIEINDYFDKLKEDAEYAIYVNGESTQNKEITIELVSEGEDIAKYEGTSHAEIITGKGMVSKLTSNDTVVTTSASGDISYKRINEGGLIINDNITITDFFSTAEKQYVKINDGERFNIKYDSETPDNNITIDVTLDNSNNENLSYSAAENYIERITGKGAIKIATLGEEDSLIFDGGASYVYNFNQSGIGELKINNISLQGEYDDNKIKNLNIYEANVKADLSTKTLTVQGNNTSSGITFTINNPDNFQFGNIIATGTENKDTFAGSNNSDTFYGGNGNDKIWGCGGNDTIEGGDGNDELYGGDGNDTINGGAGEDILVGGEGENALAGGDGNDTYKLFYKHNLKSDSLGDTQTTNEIATIEEDSGEDAGTTDTAQINGDKSNIIAYYEVDTTTGAMQGDIITIKLNSNSATMKNVEIIKDTNNKQFNFNSDALKAAISGWFSEHTDYASVDSVMNSGNETDITSLVAAFRNNGWS